MIYQLTTSLILFVIYLLVLRSCISLKKEIFCLKEENQLLWSALKKIHDFNLEQSDNEKTKQYEA
tara:strand:+ start:490 stop:684 length:195 start_codon:yes stop_codon:yes gene_type:complete